MLALGVNLPWIECGHDFGPRPPAWAGAPRTDWDSVERELARFAAIGCRVVRLWMIGAGVNLAVGRHPNEVARRVPIRRRWRFWHVLGERWAWRDRPRLPRAFLDDFEALLERARAAGVTLIPSLVSFELFLPIRDMGPVPTQGHAEVALSRGFFDATLEPLLDVAERHRGALEAFEIVNEPGWSVGPRRPKVAPERMAAFVVEGARRVARRGMRATVGFTDAAMPWMPDDARAALARMAVDGRYLHQLHHYPRVGERLAPASASPIRPVWVGEMATTRARRWSDPDAAEDDDARWLRRRIELVEARGYEGALLWSCRAEDEHTAWTPSVIAQIRGARPLT